MSPYWQTMCVLVDERDKSFTIAFNTKFELPTYKDIENMAKGPIVELLDWPDRYFVQAKSKDYWTRWFGGEEIAPHTVDLGTGICDCEDFKRNVEQARKYGSRRKVCPHILAAREEQARIKETLKIP